MGDGLLSPAHLLIILVIALVVLGPKRLPEAGKGLGQAMRGFKDSLAGGLDDDDAKAKPAPVAVQAPPVVPAPVVPPAPAVQQAPVSTTVDGQETAADSSSVG